MATEERMLAMEMLKKQCQYLLLPKCEIDLSAKVGEGSIAIQCMYYMILICTKIISTTNIRYVRTYLHMYVYYYTMYVSRQNIKYGSHLAVYLPACKQRLAWYLRK